MQEYIPIFLALVVGLSAMLAHLGYHGRDEVVGIDLGTTFSVVAVKSRKEVSVVPDHLSGKPLTPSVVSFSADGSVVVGDGAVALRDRFPLQTVFNAKRFIGRSLGEVHEDAKVHPFRVAGNTSTGSDANDSAAGFVIPGSASSDDRWVSPIAVGAHVVRQLKRSVSEFVGYEVKRAIICVPAKFSWKETKATQEAFEEAGIKVMRVLEEPTAAAVAYNLHKTQGVRHVLVYDIGGGTLDTSLLYMNGKSINVLGVAGDDHLGGSDFDQRMLTVLEAKVASAPTVVLPEGAPKHECHRHGLHVLAEEAKIQLSSADTVKVHCAQDVHGGVGAKELVVTREEFEEAAADLFRRAIEPAEKVLADQMMTPRDVHDVVLVGGTSRTPRIRSLLQEFIGLDKTLHTDIDPDVTVAYGAANIID